MCFLERFQAPAEAPFKFGTASESAKDLIMASRTVEPRIAHPLCGFNYPTVVNEVVKGW
jgi:hypothetical protein